MLCGKIAAGKSTLCGRLAAEPATIVIAQDHWMSRLYPEELKTVDDYLRLVPRVNGLVADHATALLRAGLSVVLDFPANRRASRAWMKAASDAAGADHRLHFLDVPDEICRARMHRRNAEGAHEYSASDAEFDRLTAMFEPPSPEEGLNLVVYR